MVSTLSTSETSWTEPLPLGELCEYASQMNHSEFFRSLVFPTFSSSVKVPSLGYPCPRVRVSSFPSPRNETRRGDCELNRPKRALSLSDVLPSFARQSRIVCALKKVGAAVAGRGVWCDGSFWGSGKLAMRSSFGSACNNVFSRVHLIG